MILNCDTEQLDTELDLNCFNGAQKTKAADGSINYSEIVATNDSFQKVQYNTLTKD